MIIEKRCDTRLGCVNINRTDNDYECNKINKGQSLSILCYALYLKMSEFHNLSSYLPQS